MELPSLPTDNLHKFKALAGLWLIVASLVLPFIGAVYLVDQLILWTRDMDLLSVELSTIESDLSKEEDLLEFYDAETQSLATEGDALKLLPKSSPEFDGRREAIYNKALALLAGSKDMRIRREALKGRMLDTRRQSINIRAQSDRILSLRWALLFLIVGGVGGFAGAIWLTPSGFRDWMSLQRVSDDLLRADLARYANRGIEPTRVTLE